MKIQLDAKQYVYCKKQNRDILSIDVSIDTERLPPKTITRIKNALIKGYYGSGADSVIGTGIKELARLNDLPFVFCNRAHWTAGLTFHNIQKEERDKVKEYVRSMAAVADIKVETDKDYSSPRDGKTYRWSTRVAAKEEGPLHIPRNNMLVKKEFSAILRGAMAYYSREIQSKETKEKLKEITKTF